MKEAVLYLAIGSFCGAGLRYLITLMAIGLWPTLPFGTFFANLLGCFIIGLLYPKMGELSPEAQILMITGFLGSLTTLSSYVYEVLKLFEEKRYLTSFFHFFGGAFVGLFVCAAGSVLSRKFL